MKGVLQIGFIICLLVLPFRSTYAHPGRTDSSGCHTCKTNCSSWGLSQGEYHCHGGGSSPSAGTGSSPQSFYSAPVIPTELPPLFPNIDATVKKTFDNKTKAYTLSVDWPDISWSSGYSIALSKKAGANPGPLTDTTYSKWQFSKVNPGTWYINIKARKGTQWSNTSYWKVEVPPIPSSGSQKKGIVQGIKTQQKTNAPATNGSVRKVAEFACNCSKTCSQMSSCAEAQYQLKECGCSQRDADSDGVACDSQCQ